MPVNFSLALPRDPVASFLARRAVRERLADALPAATLADVTLAVSELVTNAVIHGTGGIELRIEVDGNNVKGEVIDEGSGFERQIREEGGIDDVAGRGLLIVGQLAEAWGVHEGTTHVWFEIPVIAGQIRTIERELDSEDPVLGHPGEDQLPDVS